MDDVITARGLVKTFGSTRALDGLDLEVAPGEVHGFLGPNGAGKSTTLRILLGLVGADGGQIVVLGGHPARDAVALHRRIAYVPSDVRLWPDLTGGEIIDVLGRLQGGLDRSRRDQLIERFELDPARKARTYSRGNAQKVVLIPALAAGAELLVMDEPTSGLDPLMVRVFHDVVDRARRDGRTVLLSSHVLAEVEAIADRVSIVRRGRLVEAGPLDQLRHLTRSSVRVTADEPLDGLAGLPGLHDLELTDDGARFDVDAEHLAAVVDHLGGRRVRSMTAHPPTLEQVFLRHYAEDPVTGPADHPDRREVRS